MTFLLVLLVGGIIGWLASVVMRTDAEPGLMLNVVVGIVGALVASVLITPLVGGATLTSGSIDGSSMITSFLGALVLLAVVNLFRRGPAI